jgi:hypothetical protein
MQLDQKIEMLRLSVTKDIDRIRSHTDPHEGDGGATTGSRRHR